MTTRQCEKLTFTRNEFYDLVWSAPVAKLVRRRLDASNAMIGEVFDRTISRSQFGLLVKQNATAIMQ